jgi:lactate racemase
MPDTPSPRGASAASTVALHVGRGVLNVALPPAARVDVLRKPALPPLEEPAAAVGRALDAPVATAPLADLARGAARACVVVCDVTRPVPNGLLLRPIIDRLLAGGVPLAGITVLVATGLHRPNLGDELRAVIDDDWVFEHVRLENHDARDASRLVDLGATSGRGTPVTLHRGFVEADVRIVTGLVEPHFMAGYSGGRKVVVPGVAGARTIRSLHASRFMADPLASTANLAANPLHEEQLDIVAMVGPVFAVNTVIDEGRALAFVNAGEVEASHTEAVAFARRCSEIACEAPYDLIVTGAGGHPLDATYYQTIKAMVTPLEVLSDGGTLVVASSCAEGLGSEGFRDAQRRLLEQGPDAFLAGLRAQALAEVDEWQSQMLLRATRVGAVHLWAPGLSPADRDLIGITWCEEVGSFVADFLRTHPDARVAVLPEGPYVVPRLRPATARPR